jgi:hypothetical protein
LISKKLTIHGHVIEKKQVNNVDDRKLIPTRSTATFLGRRGVQIFYKTSPVLDYGMCGGPVCDQEIAAGKKIVRGVIEGIVPSDYPVEIARDAAVFVEAGQIRSFLTQIERGEVTPLEVGDVAEIVAKDQDPDKMDISKIL